MRFSKGILFFSGAVFLLAIPFGYGQDSPDSGEENSAVLTEQQGESSSDIQSTVTDVDGSVAEELPEATPKPKPKRVYRERIKDAEGTEALGRFEADPVIKSKYHLDGKPLEVDPD